jgi:hypothetical protein
MTQNRSQLRLHFSRCCLAASLMLAIGCSHAIPSPYVQASGPLDPADALSWDQGTDLSERFPRFVLHAQTSVEWLLLDWNGEAIYVRPAATPSELEFQSGTNKIEKLRIESGAEILSLRRYIKCGKLDFRRSPPKLGIYPPNQRRDNPLFAPSDH